MNNPDSAIVYFVDYNKPTNQSNMPQIDGMVFWYESNAKKHAAKHPGATVAPVRLIDSGLDASAFADEIAAGDAWPV